VKDTKCMIVGRAGGKEGQWKTKMKNKYAKFLALHEDGKGKFCTVK